MSTHYNTEAQKKANAWRAHIAREARIGSYVDNNGSAGSFVGQFTEKDVPIHNLEEIKKEKAKARGKSNGNYSVQDTSKVKIDRDKGKKKKAYWDAQKDVTAKATEGTLTDNDIINLILLGQEAGEEKKDIYNSLLNQKIPLKYWKKYYTKDGFVIDERPVEVFKKNDDIVK